MRRLLLALLGMFLLLVAQAKAADTFSTIDRTDMMAILQDAGLSGVTDGTTDESSPWVMGKNDKNIFVIVDFYQCATGASGPARQCGQFRYRVYWDNSRNVDAKAVNAYNERYLFGRGFISSDGKYLYIDSAMNLDGGVTRDHLLKNLSYFLLVVDSFTGMVLP